MQATDQQNQNTILSALELPALEAQLAETEALYTIWLQELGRSIFNFKNDAQLLSDELAWLEVDMHGLESKIYFAYICAIYATNTLQVDLADYDPEWRIPNEP